jgi:hypothetical protein
LVCAAKKRPRGRAFPWPGSPHRKGAEPPVCPHQTIAIVREEKKQPGQMIPIAINKLAGLAAAWISRFMGLLSTPGLSSSAPTHSRQERPSAYFNNAWDIALSQSGTFQYLKFCNKLLQFVCCRNQAFRIQSL